MRRAAPVECHPRAAGLPVVAQASTGKLAELSGCGKKLAGGERDGTDRALVSDEHRLDGAGTEPRVAERRGADKNPSGKFSGCAVR